jgi:translation initiation factor 2 alpha subunit (eIF-2alpha)
MKKQAKKYKKLHGLEKGQSIVVSVLSVNQDNKTISLSLDGVQDTVVYLLLI